MRKSFINPVNQVGIQVENRADLYTVLLTREGTLRFLHNNRQMVGLPIEGKHTKSVIALFRVFEKFRDDLEAYLIHPTNDLWWKLKEGIGA